MQNNNFYNFMPLTHIKVKVQLSDGIYLVKRQSVVVFSKEHYGVIIVGKLLNQLGFFDNHPRVFHLTKEGIHIDLLPKFNNWNSLGAVNSLQIQTAIVRLKFALLNPNYDLFSNNCEHFARYITEGYKQSTQLQNAGVLGGLAVALIFLRD
ncbi:hypothetical protein BH20ACI4_BH20ACI4_27600 [soil metagenome]